MPLILTRHFYGRFSSLPPNIEEITISNYIKPMLPPCGRNQNHQLFNTNAPATNTTIPLCSSQHHFCSHCYCHLEYHDYQCSTAATLPTPTQPPYITNSIFVVCYSSPPLHHHNNRVNANLTTFIRPSPMLAILFFICHYHPYFCKL